MICICGFFLCFTCGVYSNEVSKEEMPSLIKLFEKNDNVCVKCRRLMNDSCIHCSICNRCVNDFDHHCFWLNTCINKKNKILFYIFVYSLFLLLITNCVVAIIEFVGTFNISPVFYKVFFDYGSLDEEGNLYGQDKKNIILLATRIFLILFTLFFLYIIIFMFIPTFPIICRGIKKGQNLSRIEDSLLDNTNRNTWFLHI